MNFFIIHHLKNGGVTLLLHIKLNTIFIGTEDSKVGSPYFQINLVYSLSYNHEMM
jgi:hypothetical protein